MFYRDYLSWWLRPGFLRPGGKRSPTLFAGPWVGEFGWELLHWQAFVRKLSRGYRRTIIACQPGKEALYRDFAHDFVIHRIQGTAECNRALAIRNPEEARRVLDLIPPDADHLKPLGYQPFDRQEFIRFGRRRGDAGADILFHPRGRDFGSDRNWDRENWRSLLERLRREGFRLGCIGLKSDTLAVEGDFADHRDQPLDRTLDLIASARLVLGPSSGPMHLASLCGTPHVVWTDRKGYARGRTNREKYETWWNPLGTPVLVLDEEGFQPKVDTVFEAVRRFAPPRPALVPGAAP